ncbi:MAG TPA: M1 family metallopeptidase [Balneolaceae bacterium]|nr:M1 family metallopeptidase [Balneolaceae bacterium]
MQTLPNILKKLTPLIVAGAFVLSGCATSQQTADQAAQTADTVAEGHVVPSELNRLVPNPINTDIPDRFFKAVEQGTRTMSGKPGANYWQQWSRYDIDVELIPADTMVIGSGTITYYNNSPDTLRNLLLGLTQNFHAEGTPETGAVEVTGGIQLNKVAIGGEELSVLQSRRDQSGYAVNGTLMILRPGEALMPGDSIQIALDWQFKVPQQGAGGRMGYSQGNLFYIAYWYPRMRVYDDVIGWFTDPFAGTAEFYHGFGEYNIDITVPEQWLVTSTGILENAKEVLQEEIYQRMQKAHHSDSVMHVVTKEDFGHVTKSTEDGTITWNFSADNVRDFAFSVTKQSFWDATRANVGDLDNDGSADYAAINSIYRATAPNWKHGAKFTAQSIEFLSDFTGLSYPWPHMTSVEGAGIIGGGMEFPMMTIIGAYNNRPPSSLFSVIAHELAHMWVPMQVSNNERRYAWMDEGTTTFNEDQAMKAYYPETNPVLGSFQRYLQIAGTDFEGPIMRWSDYHYNGFAYSVASYPKPASMLASLRHLLGEETFTKAYHTFLDRWQYKHPYPWDMFNTFEDISGRNLDWFWRSWYYETWVLDQAVGNVKDNGNTTQIVIEDHGQIPMPATVAITLADGSTITKHIPVETWLKGATQAILTIDNASAVTKVVIDPEQDYPDANRQNNSWQK